MKLTDIAIRNAKAGAKPCKMFDGGGLYVEVTPNGSKLWRMKYRFGGKEKLLSFGAYPLISLKDARMRRDDARKLLANDQDPGEVKQAQKAAVKAAVTNTFEAVAREWFSKWKTDKAPTHFEKVISRLEHDVFPYIGKKPITVIQDDAPMVLSVLQRIVDRGYLETAHRAKGNISQVMRYAIATGRAKRDPCPDLRGALPTPVKKHMAALTDPKAVGELLRNIDGYQGRMPEVQAALKLAPLLFVRIGELRAAKWADIDLDGASWSFIASKTKTPHIVPLARQAVAILRDIHLRTGGGKLVFPGQRSKDRPISDAAINIALRSMGYDTQDEMTGHGFRTTACTMLSERLRKPTDWIERQLAHKVPGALADTYNRTQFLDDRRPMMQEWADYLDELKRGAPVIQLRASQ